MASFLENLWTSIFTPGPTPSLLIATNVSFAALQLVLIICLFATWSIHFVVLSVLSCGLWWSVNWFARELAIAQAAHASEEERTKLQETSADMGLGSTGATSGRSGLDVTDSDDDTETEGASSKVRGQPQQRRAKGEASGGVKTNSSQESGATLSTGAFNTAAAAKLAPESVKQRRNLAESTGDLSTDSEWEQVDNE